MRLVYPILVDEHSGSKIAHCTCFIMMTTDMSYEVVHAYGMRSVITLACVYIHDGRLHFHLVLTNASGQIHHWLCHIRTSVMKDDPSFSDFCHNDQHRWWDFGSWYRWKTSRFQSHLRHVPQIISAIAISAIFMVVPMAIVSGIRDICALTLEPGICLVVSSWSLGELSLAGKMTDWTHHMSSKHTSVHTSVDR